MLRKVNPIYSRWRFLEQSKAYLLYSPIVSIIFESKYTSNILWNEVLSQLLLIVSKYSLLYSLLSWMAF